MKTAAATLLALALAASPAAARPILDPPDQSDIALPTRVIVQADEGFDWGSAGIGAAATGGLALIAAGGLVAARRGRFAS